MKRLVGLVVLAAAAGATMAQTCVLRNQALTAIGNHDVFAGEMRNDSGVNILEHRYRVAFLNSNNAVVETMTVDGCVRSLQNGASDFFSARSSEPDESTTIALARLANLAEDPSFEVGQTEEGDLAFSDVTATRDNDILQVTGTMTNDDNDDLDDPAVCVVVWSDAGRVVTTARVEVQDLDAGAARDFTVTLDVPDDADLVNEVDVWADGLEHGVPIDPQSERGIDIEEGNLTPVPTATNTPTVTPTP
jgi:hypothetical protein